MKQNDLPSDVQDLLDEGTKYRVVSYDNGRLVLLRISGPRQTLLNGTQVIVRKT